MTFLTIASLHLGFYQLITAGSKLSISSSKPISGYSSVTGEDIETAWNLKVCALRNKTRNIVDRSALLRRRVRLVYCLGFCRVQGMLAGGALSPA